MEIPSLGMVDDIMSIQKCSANTVANNAVINAVMERKKLKLLSQTKCKRMHIKRANKKNDEHKQVVSSKNK